MKLKEEKTKEVGMGFIWKIILWIIGALIILLGLLIFYRGIQAGIFMKVFLSGILLVLSGFIALPVFNNFTIKYFNIKLSGWLRFFLCLVLLISAIVILFYAIVPKQT